MKKILFNRNRLFLLLIVLLAAALRLFKLGSQVIWVDEAWTIVNAKLPIPVLVKMVASVDFHPPLYYIFLHYWIKIFGSGPLAARLPSLLFDLGGLLAVYRLGTSLGKPGEEKKTGLTAALLYAVSAFLIMAAQEARMYPMLNFFLLSSLWYFYRALTQNRFKDWACFTLFLTAAAYTHYITFHILTAFILGYFLLLAFRQVKTRSFPAFSASIFSLFILYLPWAGIFADRFFNRRQIDPNWPIGELVLNALHSLEMGTVSHYGNCFQDWFWILILLICPLAGIISLLKEPVKLVPALLFLVYPLGISVLLPLLTGKQTFNPAHLITSAGILFLFWGLGSAALLRIPVLRILPYPLLFVFLCFNGVTLCNWDFNSYFQRENWEPIVRTIEKMEKPGDVVLVQTGHRVFPFRYNFKGRTPVIPADNLEKLPSDALFEKKRVWLVENCSDVTDPEFSLRNFLIQNGKPVFYFREDNFASTGMIEIRLYKIPELSQ